MAAAISPIKITFFRLSSGTADAAIPIIKALSPDKTISAIII
jgi:hypothetical protein